MSRSHFDSHIYIKNNRRWLLTYNEEKHRFIALRLHYSDTDPNEPNYNTIEQQFIDYINHKLEFVHNHQRRIESIIQRFGSQ